VLKSQYRRRGLNKVPSMTKVKIRDIMLNLNTYGVLSPPNPSNSSSSSKIGTPNSGKKLNNQLS